MKKLIFIGFALLCAFSCTPMDEYLQIAGKEEIVYPGKIEDVEVRTGHDRLLVEGWCYSDAKITSCRIYWSLGEDYVEVPVDMSDGPFKLSKEIALSEGTYNFEIYTYDAFGNRSIPVNVSSRTYGDGYMLLMTNRLVSDIRTTRRNHTIKFYNIDTTTGAYKTELTYTDATGTPVTVDVLPSQSSVTIAIEECDATKPVSVVTVYKPDETCLDEFRTEPDTYSFPE